MGWHYTKCGGGFALPLTLCIIGAIWLNGQADAIAHMLATAMEWLAGGIALGGIGTAAIVTFMYYSHRNPIWSSAAWNDKPMIHEQKVQAEWYELARPGVSFTKEYAEGE